MVCSVEWRKQVTKNPRFLTGVFLLSRAKSGLMKKYSRMENAHIATWKNHIVRIGNRQKPLKMGLANANNA
jgi:hypothetical protein